MSAVIKSYWYGGLELVSVFDALSSRERDEYRFGKSGLSTICIRH